VRALEVAQAVVDVGEDRRDGTRTHDILALVVRGYSKQVGVLTGRVVGRDALLVDLGVLGETGEEGAEVAPAVLID
jgi:hypothetical protein